VRKMNSKSNKARGYVVTIIDMFSIIIAFYFSIMTKNDGLKSISIDIEYQDALIIILLLYFVISRSYMKVGKNIFKRGYVIEFLVVFRSQALTMMSWLCYLFITKQGSTYSRFIFVIFFGVATITVYVARCYFKLFTFIILKNSKSRRNCIVITVKARAEEIITKIVNENDWDINISGIVIIDEDLTGESICGVYICGNSETVCDSVMYQAVDEVFINIPYEYKVKLEGIILIFEKMGILVNLNIDIYNMDVKNKTIDRFSVYNVVSFATNIYNFRSVLIKRMIDIVGSIVGLLIMFVAIIFVAPVIKLESKGPVFFSQKRVGKNGRIFNIYKLRSMYINAEEQKKELMDQNEMHGLMFKMKDDPRITKVGKFIRKTSIDELPQFWNILNGDMSLVGTRPPTVDEFNQYETKHRRRLSIKPGLTGLWQVSGRNQINDFDDVVKFDLEYIDNWSVGLDIKLLLKTLAVVVTRTGN